jgi:hypothetical protein
LGYPVLIERHIVYSTKWPLPELKKITASIRRQERNKEMQDETNQTGNDEPLQAALHDLEAAERQLTQARAEEASAERKVEEAVEELKSVEHRRFQVEIVYNGVTKPFHVEKQEQVTALLKRAIEEFRIVQNPHLLSLYRLDGSQVPEQGTVEQAHLKPGEVLLLRPNAVKGGATPPLRLAREHISRTFEILRGCGRRAVECVVYWTGPTTDDLIDGLEHPDHGSTSFGYEVGDQWLTEFWKHLALSGRSVRAQVHTHPGAAFHSATDDRWPIVAQPGFLSVVVPDFAAGRPSLDDAWIGRLETGGRWRRLESPSEAFILA